LTDEHDPYLSEAFIKALHARVVSMEGNLAENTDATKRNTEAIEDIAKDTRGIIEMFSALEGGFKVLSGIGRLAKPIFYIVSACGAVLGLVAAWKGAFK
jgi:hypothetical protein